MMLMIPLHRMVLVLLFATATGFSPAQQDIYNYENSLRFADYLLKTGQFHLASNELERLVFLQPQNDSVKLLLLNAYSGAEDFERGIKRTEEFFPDHPTMPASFARTYSKMLLQDKDFTKWNQFDWHNETLIGNDKFFLRLHGALYQKRWNEAQQLWNSSEDARKYFPFLEKMVENMPPAQYKNPWIATTLSAVLPGAGKLYTKNPADALLSFITIGALSFQAYRGFNSKGISSGYGWIFGSLAFGFYSGNIYGSYKAAKKYNSFIDEKFFSDIDKNFAEY